MKIKLANTEIIHFVGIGGIGMSGLALIMQGLGFTVQGSDISFNKNIDRLKKKNIKVLIGHKKNNVKNSTILVVSSAIKKNNPELLEAKIRNLPIYKRGEMLGNIVSLMKNVVIAGSHGKTTTTSLISSIFSNAKLDPTVINGGVLNSYGNSAKLGKSEWCILESDESDGSFLNIPITYSIITNIDLEHLDYYGNLQSLKTSFKKFIEKTHSFGKCFICIDDKLNREVIKMTKNKNVLTYGTNSKSHFRITNVLQEKKFSQFNIIISLPGKVSSEIKKIRIPIIGMHNIRNAAAASAVCFSIGISGQIIKRGLKNYQGVQRRFNHLFNYKNSEFFDDYAHHPTEIKCVLQGIKNVYKNKKVFCIFQPHRISRVNQLKKLFAESFKHSDILVLCPIYKAGENIKLNFSYKSFAKLIVKKSKVILIIIKNEKDLFNFVKRNIFGENIIIGMGAGSISNWIRDLQVKLK